MTSTDRMTNLKLEVLSCLRDNPGCSTRAISNELGEDLNDVEAALQLLIRDGIVTANTSPKGQTRYHVIEGHTRLLEPGCDGDSCTIGAPSRQSSKEYAAERAPRRMRR